MWCFSPPSFLLLLPILPDSNHQGQWRRPYSRGFITKMILQNIKFFFAFFLWTESGRHMACCQQKAVLFCLYLTCHPVCPSPSILRCSSMLYHMFFCCLKLTFFIERPSHPWTVFPFLEVLAMSCAKDLRVFKVKDKTQTSKKIFWRDDYYLYLIRSP